ncbi:PTS sugar transporter subunit IIC [Streptomyces canarius]
MRYSQKLRYDHTVTNLTVGVATVIMLSGIGFGAANLGIVAVGMGLCFASYKANNLGTALAHVLGSLLKFKCVTSL